MSGNPEVITGRCRSRIRAVAPQRNVGSKMLVVFLFFLVEISGDQTRPAAETVAAAQWSSMFPLGLWVGGWGEEPVVVVLPITRGALSQQLLKSFFTTQLQGGGRWGRQGAGVGGVRQGGSLRGLEVLSGMLYRVQ